MAKKKIKGIIIAVVVTATVGTGAVFGVRRFLQNRSAEVEVTSVASQNAAEWLTFGMDESTSGMVVSDVNQQVNIPDDKVINEVYVSEGDDVKIGDKLLSYDTTLLELDKELQELTVQEIQLEIKSAEADLKKLQNTTPVARKETDDDLGGSDFNSRGNEDLARTAGNNEELRMASADAVDVSETAAAVPAEESDPGKTASDPAAEESAAGAEGQDSAREGTDDIGMVGEVIAGDEIQVMEPENPEDQGSQGVQDVLGDPDDAEEEKNASYEQKKKGKMNLSLKNMLTHIRMKTMPEDGDLLLADTGKEQQNGALAGMPSGKVRVIPHFREMADSHFEKQNTYMMLIEGLDVEKEITGKVYGIGEINGEDYPEIGGYTLTREPSEEKTDVARLTVAFHDGLDEQHEKKTELEDAYLEIVMDVAELNTDKLVFRPTANQEDDLVIRTEKASQEPETPDTNGTSPDNTNPSNGDASDETNMTESELVPEQEESDFTNPDEETTESETQDSEAQESESEDDDPSKGETIQKVVLNVTWRDGTNDPESYPEELALSFYDGQSGTGEPVKTITLSGSREPDMEPGPDSPAGSDEPETEPETESDSGNQDETEDNREETVQTEGKTQIFENPDAKERTWTKTVDWSSDPETLKNYSMEMKVDGKLPIELYYMLEGLSWSETTADAAIVLNLTFAYQEPSESPIVKLEAISELTYENGQNTEKGSGPRAYKGSGTREDPYVFFVTDGVVIKSSFVNWVLGFNSEGTERRKDTEGNETEGVYVRLEIRESDTITGAFIRSIDLDGTIRMDYGYAPGTYWVFRSDTGITRYEEEVDDEPGDDGGFDDGDVWGNDFDGETYTAEELAEAIKEKEREIRKLKLDERSAQLKLKKYVKDLEESTVVSSVNGYVKSIGGNEESGEPYMVVSSQGGLYLRTTISELDLNTIKKDDVLTVTSWETNNQFQATVTEISYYPSSSTNENYYFGSGNTNASTYPVLAHIEDASGVSAYENVTVKFPTAASDVDIYIPKAYIRSENGQSYVYKRGEDGRLKKQYVHTAGITSGYVGIKEGLSTDDYIAFPYGKNVKDGAKTIEEVNEFF